MQEVYEFLKACGTYYLATLDGSQPRVRPFGTVDLYNGKLTIQTGRSKDVSRQMLANPQVEICAFNGQRWLRVAAKAVEVPELAAQEHMLDAYPNLRAMYAPGDGNTPDLRSDRGHRHLLLLHRAQPHRHVLSGAAADQSQPRNPLSCIGNNNRTLLYPFHLKHYMKLKLLIKE